MGTAEEVAAQAVFLASPQAGFTTGTNVVIDGGLTKRIQFKREPRQGEQSMVRPFRFGVQSFNADSGEDWAAQALTVARAAKR